MAYVYKKIRHNEMGGCTSDHICITFDNGDLMSFPAEDGNPHYDALMERVSAGDVTIIDETGD